MHCIVPGAVCVCTVSTSRVLCCAVLCCRCCSHLSIGRYHQHSTDALDNSMSPLEFFAFTYPNTPTFKRETDEWRAYLGRCAPRVAPRHAHRLHLSRRDAHVVEMCACVRLLKWDVRQALVV